MNKLILMSLLLGSLNVFAFELKENAIGIDVRTSGELWLNPSVNSVHIPVSKLKNGISSVVEDKSTPLYVFCQSGGRSAKAHQLLTDMGYENVIDVQTWEKWNALNQSEREKP